MRVFVQCFGLAVLGLVGIQPQLLARQSGQAVFEQKCVACHSVGSDRLVGPGLAGVLTRRDRAWVKQFIMHPDQMLTTDSIAIRLLEEYLITMPNLAVTDGEVEALIAYLGMDGGGASPVSPTLAVSGPAAEEDVLMGQRLFEGRTRFANAGPTCNSCHDITNDAVIGGGVLAAELTSVFSRLGGPGVRAILGSPPFPVMQRAYADKPLTDEEVVALVGFLQRVDEEQGLHQPKDYGIRLVAAGVVGAAILLFLYALIWGKRKRSSVNEWIYERQVKST